MMVKDSLQIRLSHALALSRFLCVRLLCFCEAPAMTSSVRCALTLLVLALPCSTEEIAFGDVSADGSLETRSLDVPVAMARGAENLFIPNPMDSHDWSHTSVVRNSLQAAAKAKAKVAGLEDVLRPIFSAMPKDASGRLNNGTARYALHRLFSEKHGWSIKGLQPAGAAWMATMSVTPDVKDVTKYMVPTYLQQLLSTRLGVDGFDLHSLAILATAIEHLIHAEIISIMYSVYTTLGLPVPGKRTEKEVHDILDTFTMVYAFGINLEVSTLEDVKSTKAYLEKSHSGWPQLQAFTRDVKRSTSSGSGLDFGEIVQVAEKIGEGYVKWQGKDCLRVKDELVAKPSHREGRVQLSEVQRSDVMGRRSLFTESAEDMEKLGVLSKASDEETQLIIPNYVNSQSMCLSTASFYTACCVNECEGLLARLEREVAAPTAEPKQLQHLMAALPGPGIPELLLQELPTLVDQVSGMVPLHGRGLAGWMHRAFPLECPALDQAHNQKVTNPKTPDEWIGESGLQVQELEEMMEEIAQGLARYTTMGKKAGEEAFIADDPVSDADTDVVRVHAPILAQIQPQRQFLATAFRFAAMSSMMGFLAVAARSGLSTTSPKDKALKNLDNNIKFFV